MKDILRKKLTELADTAVSEGRCNWDGYYGRDNEFHLGQLKEAIDDAVAEIVALARPRAIDQSGWPQKWRLPPRHGIHLRMLVDQQEVTKAQLMARFWPAKAPKEHEKVMSIMRRVIRERLADHAGIHIEIKWSRTRAAFYILPEARDLLISRAEND